jgi:heat-inducible transcriptional repressor
MQNDRRLAVLRAIVEDYVSTEEPVGSKALVERHGLGVSPATVRNDMAVLEEEGYITQPHTSAGRVPTDKGYRLFVDRLTTVKPMSPAEKRAIASFLDGAVDLDDVVQRSVRLLSQLTRQVAVVQYPILAKSTVRHVELVALTPTRLLVVLILSTGRVEQRLVEVPTEVDEETLADLRSRVNRAAVGEVIADAATALRALPEQLAGQLGGQTGGQAGRQAGGRAGERSKAGVASAIVESLVEAMSDHRSDERIAVAGASNLARYGDSFDTSVRPLLEALEEHVVLLKLIGEATSGGLVTVRIGAEGPYEELSSTSVVTTGYGPGDEALATLGVVGPTRMDYPGTMAAVRAVARYVSRILDEA